MRKHLYLITDHSLDEDKVGLIESTDSPKATTASKNEEGVSEYRNFETGEEWTQHEVGLGYVDFEDEQDYEENWGDAVKSKLAEIDDEYLEKARFSLGVRFRRLMPREAMKPAASGPVLCRRVQ